MSQYLTQYGELKAISTFNTYPDGQIKDCVLNEKVDIPTPLGLLTPQYEHAELRRKHIYSVSFFQSGKISRIALNEQTEVETPLGKLPAELITFYESGSIKRLFPLNGQISGYWGEDDEYDLAHELNFKFPFGSIRTKLIGIYFYENGTIQSLTLWPKETITVITPLGEQKVRIGLSLYPGGNIKSFEPANPIDVMTPIGLINAFDSTANGITGDKNSLNFTENGTIKSLTTLSSKTTVMNPDQTEKLYSPSLIQDVNGEEIFLQPLKIDFFQDRVCFNGQDEYKIGENHFKIEPYYKPIQNKCSDCASCTQCSLDLQKII
ncbi:conserved hypothetical protein [Candidatus Desulfosporosinus infrequens]|uniref:Uncharacterized protein n=1 Tax=Candidatus Desulfosporosinus infrequens TaxID=2043169 RepID=A0A2U3LQT0_9FIRM|nr:conserved hypothetical protein [Candidatus Desulfosporosinus infrequens]